MASAAPTLNFDEDERAALLAGEDRFLRMIDLRRVTQLSESELYRRLGAGRFPQGHKIGPKTVVWRLSVVQRWFDSLSPVPIAELPAPAVHIERKPPRPTPDGLLSEEKIVGAAVKIVASGIYFLIADGEVVYVGQSSNVLARVASHRGLKQFDAWHHIPCGLDGLDELERRYIDHYRPRLNAIGVRIGVRPTGHG